MSAATDGSIAVVGGTGHQGSALALRWAAAGIPVLLGSRDGNRARVQAQVLMARLVARSGAAPIAGMSNDEVVQQARRVVLTVPFAAHVRTLRALRDSLLPGTVLVDVTVPLAVAVGGPATQTITPWAGSAAEQAAGLVPEGISVCAAFQHLAAGALAELDTPVDCDVLVCGDMREAKGAVRLLVQAIPGARYVDAGPLERARLVEPLGALLIALNLRHKVDHCGLRITGLPG